MLSSVHNHKAKFIISEDVNINYFATSNKKQKLDNPLATYNTIGTVVFPARTVNNPISMIDNIFIYNRKNYTTKNRPFMYFQTMMHNSQL
jgi:hypothetical protein